MPRPRSAMRKIREVLRLSQGEGLSRRQVAQAAGVPPTTVADYLGRLAAAGLGRDPPRAAAAVGDPAAALDGAQRGPSRRPPVHPVRAPLPGVGASPRP